MKKILALVLAAMLVLSVGIAFADGDQTPTSQDASFSKVYKITNSGTVSPAETFTFTYTADKVTDSNMNLSASDMPAISASTVKFDAGAATTSGESKTVNVALSDITWPGVGVYYYQVAETAGSTAGVVYDPHVANLKVTVAYDEDTGTYYTAFVAMSLADDDGDGTTDEKTDTYTNEYRAGDLSISKTVTGNLGDQNAYFAVDVTLTGVSDKTYASTYTVKGGSKIEDGETACSESTITIGTKKTFYLKHGETIKIANLPYDVTYVVAEQDYTTEANGKYDLAVYTLSDSNKKIDSAEDTVAITNNKGIVVDTGISMDSLPYIVLLGIVVLAGVARFLKKRSEND